MAVKLADVQLDGDTFQQTYIGKNLLPYPYADGDSKTTKGIAYAVNADGTVILNGQNDGTGSSAYYFVDRWGSMPMLELSAGTYYFIPNSEGVEYEMYGGSHYYTLSGNNNYTVTFQSDVSIRQVYIVIRKTNQTQFNNYKIYPMLTTVAGQTALDYEPYVVVPNPDDPQDIQVVTGAQTVKLWGKNLVIGSDFNDLNGWTVSAADKYRACGNHTLRLEIPAEWNGFCKIYRRIPTVASHTYYISVQMSQTKTETSQFFLSDDPSENYPSPQLSLGQRPLVAFTQKSTFVTAPIDNAYFGIMVQSHNRGDISATFKDIICIDMTELFGEGNIPSLEWCNNHILYELGIQQIIINLGNIELCKIGGYQDCIYSDGSDWYVHKENGKIILNGSETWSATSMTNNWLYYTVNAGMEVVASGQMPSIISNYFSVTTTDGQWTSVAGSKSITLNNTASPNTQIRFTVGDSTNKLADFKTWLGSNNTTVYYALATPTDTKITDATLLASLNSLAHAMGADEKTNVVVSATGTNLASPLTVSAYRKTLAGIVENL